MNEKEILEALAEKTAEELEALYNISSVFTAEELKAISTKLQDANTRNIIKNFI